MCWLTYTKVTIAFGITNKSVNRRGPERRVVLLTGPYEGKRPWLEKEIWTAGKTDGRLIASEVLFVMATRSIRGWKTSLTWQTNIDEVRKRKVTCCDGRPIHGKETSLALFLRYRKHAEGKTKQKHEKNNRNTLYKKKDT